MSETEFLMGVREALLMMLDLVERKLGISPRTSEIRKAYKNAHQ
jgi:hypothetical protein